jgi:putative flippase GtrA
MSSGVLESVQFRQIGRYVLTGGLNTAVGFSVIIGLLSLGLGDIMANALGFCFGLLISFFVNRSWTFQQYSKPTRSEFGLFMSSFLIAYMVNFLIILMGSASGYGGSWPLHLLGVSAYTGSFYLLSKQIVYGDGDFGALTEKAWGKLHRNWPNFAILTIIVAATPLLLQLKLTHDVSWQFWIARQMAHGVPLYERIMEINPPLWFWMALPLQILATEMGVRPDRLYIIAIILITAWSVLTTVRLVYENGSNRMFGAMAVMLALFWIAPMYDFGQREQLTILLSLPYCALLFKRVRGEPVFTPTAIFISCMAAVGFALKHYFVLVPLSLELWYFLHHRRPTKLFRLEIIMLGSLAAIYAVAIFFYTPAFVTKIIPLVSAAYNGYERSFVFQLLRPECLVWICSVFTFLQLRKSVERRDQQIADALAIAGIAFAASYFLQQKGWQYHAIPATVCASLLILHLLSCQRDMVKTLAAHPLTLIGAVLFIIVGVARGPYNSEWASDMPKYLAGAKKGDSVMILTADPRRVFPFIDDAKLIWPSRHFAHWMIAAISKAERDPARHMTPELRAVAINIQSQALEDVKCHPPSLILSQIRNKGYSISPQRFRMTDFFRRNSDFKDYLSHNYRLESQDKQFEIYRRITPFPPAPQGCYPVFTA